MNIRRVAVTGIGVVSSAGTTVEEFFSTLIEGKSCIDRVTGIELADSPSLIAGEVKNERFDPYERIDRKIGRRMDRFALFGLYAAEEALAMSGFPAASVPGERVGVVVGSGIGGIATSVENTRRYDSGGHRKVSPFFIPMFIPDIISGHISIIHGFRGPNYSTSSACASAAHAIGCAFNHIALGDAEVMVAGGSDACIVPVVVAGFTQIQALSTKYNDTPQKASRPFDRERDGFVIAEGAGVLVLEEWEHAHERGAKVLAELVSCGMSADAHHITAPCDDGSGAALAMKAALRKAGVDPSVVGLVNAHGTSTPLGDRAETMAMKDVFGDHAKRLLVNSTKSMIGHTLGAAAAIEAVAVVKMLQTGIIHPTINYEFPDEGCDLDYVPNTAVRKQVEYALSNSFGFGGHNGSLLFRRAGD